jgi:hypothetical protein
VIAASGPPPSPRIAVADETPDRPRLRLLPSVAEAQRFACAYRDAEDAGDDDLRASLGDQLFVRQQLLAIADDRLSGFEARADKVIELAFYGEVAMALAYAVRPFADIQDAVARHQEFTA